MEEETLLPLGAGGAVPAAEQALRTILPKSRYSHAAGARPGSTCRSAAWSLMCSSSAPGRAAPGGCCVKQAGTWLSQGCFIFPLP